MFSCSLHFFLSLSSSSFSSHKILFFVCQLPTGQKKKEAKRTNNNTNLLEGYRTFMSLVAVFVDWSECVWAGFFFAVAASCILKTVWKPFISKIEEPTYGLKWIWCFGISCFFTCFWRFFFFLCFLLLYACTVVLPKHFHSRSLCGTHVHFSQTVKEWKRPKRALTHRPLNPMRNRVKRK